MTLYTGDNPLKFKRLGRHYCGVHCVFRSACTGARVGDAARSLPAPRRLRRSIALLAHTFHTPIAELYALPLAELDGWLGEARKIWRAKAGK